MTKKKGKGEMLRGSGDLQVHSPKVRDLSLVYRKRLEQTLMPLGEINGFKVRPGLFRSFGTEVLPGAVNFTIHSKNAEGCELLLFHRDGKEPFGIIPIPQSYRIGDVYSIIVFGLDIFEFEYAYRLEGPWNPSEGLLFDPKKELLDPYAKAVVGQSKWGQKRKHEGNYRSRVVAGNFYWGESSSPGLTMDELIIYELHVRGFTYHPSSRVRFPGTYAGLREKIPYLKELGINAVELMPIFEFDEMLDAREHEGRQLMDYWGYNPISFFAPNTAYTGEMEYNREGDELKQMIKAFHDNDIAVILDVVFNHTAEGNEEGPVISFKGFDNNIYYMLTPEGHYYNFSGCGNTFNANHPVVQNLIIECLRYWVTEYRVDGFRFDLASILGRAEDGSPLANAPLLKSLAFDPILSKVYLIAEAWDAGGLYQVGSFPSWKRWSEWNGKYRDDMRRFLKGDEGMALAAANRISGSHDLYDPIFRGRNASVNFITCHDGFTLRDLYSYNEKHNWENGWENTDGENNNNSWNCGVEGPTEEEGILALRKRLTKNACAVLLSSQGTPMLLAGDEFGNSQGGNNNPYCQDNEISWLNWEMLEEHKEIFHFFKGMIELRKKHPVLSNRTEAEDPRLPSVSYHGVRPWDFKPLDEHHYVGVMLAGDESYPMGEDIFDVVYIAVNAHWESAEVELPELEAGFVWRVEADTSRDMGEDVGPGVCQEALVDNRLIVPPRTVILLSDERETSC